VRRGGGKEEGSGRENERRGGEGGVRWGDARERRWTLPRGKGEEERALVPNPRKSNDIAISNQHDYV
jgi:hypothetical protein